MKRKLTNKQKAYMVDYQKTKTRRINFQLSLEYDSDILEYLDSIPNKNAYLKELVRADIKQKNGQPTSKIFGHHLYVDMP